MGTGEVVVVEEGEMLYELCEMHWSSLGGRVERM